MAQMRVIAFLLFLFERQIRVVAFCVKLQNNQLNQKRIEALRFRWALRPNVSLSFPTMAIYVLGE